jgi:hypothetical protein
LLALPSVHLSGKVFSGWFHTTSVELGSHGLESRHGFHDSFKFDWMLVSIDGQCIEATDSFVGHPLFHLLSRQSRELHQLVYFIIGRVWVLDVVLVPTVQYLV